MPVVTNTDSALDRENRALSFGAFFYFTFYLVAAELQLKWNRIEGVQSVAPTAQIIPLGIGSLSLLRSLWIWIAHNYK